MPTLNWSTVLDHARESPCGPTRETDRLLLPPGDYLGMVTEARAGLSRTSNKPMITVRAVVLDGEHAGDRLPTLFLVISETTGAVFHFLRKLAALGISRERLGAEDPSLEAVADWVVGARAVFTVKVEQYDGHDRNTTEDVRPLASSMPSSG